MKRGFLGAAAFAAIGLSVSLVVPAHAATNCNGDCLLTGGVHGAYFGHFGPPVQKALADAWADVPIATSSGTPDNMNYILAHPNSFGLAQGNAYAYLLATDAKKYDGHFTVLQRRHRPGTRHGGGNAAGI